MLTSRRTRLLAALAICAITTLPFATQIASAQHNTPIIISDGSLTIEFRETPFARFTPRGRDRFHPETGKSVSSVEITMPGNNQTLDISGQQAEVTVRYGKTKIVVATGTDGKGLRFNTDLNDFHHGEGENFLAHNDESLKISRVTVKKAGKTVFSARPTGGTKILINYQ